ncbi:replication endonuclease [Neiella marina]|uniref:Replication endonuclease n=1 Tax=Neiella holothuriorum TaxID=2870530 RepID=A0ABS7EBP3_9GAMM|nr:replication endonuclease [Neiella holothuriorum]MBW8189675.1 replication endonuclease [Neiella holothuriorum]
MPEIDSQDRKFVDDLLGAFPLAFRAKLICDYKYEPSRRLANLTLLRRRKEVAQKLGIRPEFLRLDVSEEELREKAKRRSQYCQSLEYSNLSTIEQLKAMTRYVNGFRINAPSANSPLTGTVPVTLTGLDLAYIEGAIKRMCNYGWWLRKLRRRYVTDVETAAQILGFVNKFKGIYASDFALRNRLNQKAYQDKLLSSTVVMNQLGQEFTLKELQEKNVSNPAIRKAELMMRMRGFEELSEEHGHSGVFLTFTCPSRFHACHSFNGQRNEKWDGSTPYEGQQYLCTLFARVRAQWNREGIRPYGFRVAEPHHDGTPHWHLLLFVEPELKRRLLDICKQYCFEIDGNESGAVEHRFKAVEIDPDKGSATGYIAKYVSKNIDGEHLDEGVYGESPLEAAVRVDAWASCWAIRQFQQIGGASVTVWRELRRLKRNKLIDERLIAIFDCADSGNWSAFIQKMGGIWCKPSNRPIRILYKLVVDEKTGECKGNAFGDGLLMRLKGLLVDGREVITRLFDWQLVSKGPKAL